jgi:uncharacterized protein (TIGR02145 family)
MAENLRTTKYRNSTLIQNITTNNTEWQNNTSGAWSYYNNDVNNNVPYGKLYNWYAVNNTNQLCPTGWHVPTDAEWNILITNLDPSYNPTFTASVSTIAGGKMKSTGYWISPNTGATNSSGWSGLPGGGRGSTGAFEAIGFYGSWWSSTEASTTDAWYRYMLYNNGDVTRFPGNKALGFSVRCLRD